MKLRSWQQGEVPTTLFVDDDPSVRRALTRMAQRLGIVASVAASAEEALALARVERYCLILIDLRLPGMQGEELLDRLRAMLPDARLVVLTGEQAVPTVTADIVLHKPWDPKVLSAVLLEGTRPSAECPDQRPDRPTQTLPPPSVSPPRRPLKLLLVEDSRVDARLLEATLEKSSLDHDLTLVETLEAARHALEAEAFDAVLTDLGLPDSEGITTVYSVLMDAGETPVLVLTGNDDGGLARDAVQAGAQDYLVKGHFTPDSLARSLRLAVERKRGERHIKRLALTDALTGLANRASYRERLAHAIARCRRTGRRFATALVDMDNFKALNDTHGHDAGDAFLTQIAARMRLALRDSDTVARFGGDEFALLLEEVESADEAIAACERVRESLAEPFRLDQVVFTSSASVGVAVYPDAGKTTDALIEAADTSLYESKRGGRNRVTLSGPIRVLTRTTPGFRLEETSPSVPARRFTSLAPPGDGALPRELTVVEADSWGDLARLLPGLGPDQLILVDERELDEARLSRWHDWQGQGARLGIRGFGGHRAVHELPGLLPAGLVVIHPRVLALRGTSSEELLRAVLQLAGSRGTLTAGDVSARDAEALGLAWSLTGAE